MKARISQLHKTEIEWLKYSNWMPEAGEIIIYDPDTEHNYARIKIGDGKRTLKELDFLIDSTIDDVLKQISFTDVLDGGRITEYNK